MTKRNTAALLTDPSKPRRFHIHMDLQLGQTADFIYTDRDMAHHHYEQLRAQMVCGGLAIKKIQMEEQV